MKPLVLPHHYATALIPDLPVAIYAIGTSLEANYNEDDEVAFVSAIDGLVYGRGIVISAQKGVWDDLYDYADYDAIYGTLHSESAQDEVRAYLERIEPDFIPDVTEITVLQVIRIE